MSPLQTLAPDQRAVLELLLRQGRSYAELSELLGLPEDAVRDRAHAALAALAPDTAAPVGEDGAVADWILGQSDDPQQRRSVLTLLHSVAIRRPSGGVLPSGVDQQHRHAMLFCRQRDRRYLAGAGVDE